MKKAFKHPNRPRMSPTVFNGLMKWRRKLKEAA